MRYKFQILFTLLVLMFLVIVSGCTQEKVIGKNLTSDKYVPIEFINFTRDESSLYDLKHWGDPWIVVDEYNNIITYIPMGDSNGAPIIVDNFNKTIRGVGLINVTDDLKAVLVYCHGEKIPSKKDGGAVAYGIYELPYYLEGEAKILDIDDNGSVKIEYKGNNITLKPGEEWSNVTFNMPAENNDKANITTSIKIKNYGIWNKSGISGQFY